MIEHPAECGHSVCIVCTKEHWWPKEPAYPLPSEYGAPKAADLDEEVGELWAMCNLRDALKWEAAMTEMEETHLKHLMERADPKACPLCRAHLKDAPNNSW